MLLRRVTNCFAKILIVDVRWFLFVVVAVFHIHLRSVSRRPHKNFRNAHKIFFIPFGYVLRSFQLHTTASRWWEFLNFFKFSSFQYMKARRMKQKILAIFALVFNLFGYSNDFSIFSFSTFTQIRRSCRAKRYYKKYIRNSEKLFSVLWMIKCDDWTLDSWKCSDFFEFTVTMAKEEAKESKKLKRAQNKHFFLIFYSLLAGSTWRSGVWRKNEWRNQEFGMQIFLWFS